MNKKNLKTFFSVLSLDSIYSIGSHVCQLAWSTLKVDTPTLVKIGPVVSGNE
jgi:hypothetical protein